AYEDPADLESFLPNPMRRMTAASVTDPSVLVAQLADVRRTGLARERGEVQPGLACTAAPLVINGLAVGAISVSVPGAAVLEPRSEAALRETATLIDRELCARLAEGRSHWFPRDF
ncbi:MAG TPA: IclR family transcriptional regulator C-terminal domain-containing protein, partial [Gemmatimonadales bacterium]|nr:IclR family transcriptional regulator C-terminal domain-containing protein [Gemmatimonadales bacterium]